MGNCCINTFRKDPDGNVLWYLAQGSESLAWQDRETGFGYRRKISYRDATLDDPGYNRLGNVLGELSGKVLFFANAVDGMDYSDLDEECIMHVRPGDKLFAKAFFNIPLGWIPIGENNISSKHPRGEGACLLASRPRLIALFVDVNGEPQPAEHFCADSKTYFQNEVKTLGTDPKPATPDNAISGSFLTFMCAKEQDPYCFLHLPLVGTLSDTSFVTGQYGETLVRAFTSLLQSLAPGEHKVELRVRYFYDHCDYNCLVLGDGTNALGRWYKRVSNAALKMPHEAPDALETPEDPIAAGSVRLEVPEGFRARSFLDLFERKPPPEVYNGEDASTLRRCAKTVAGGKFCEQFNLRGLPDHVVLTSDIQTKTVTCPELLTGKYSYEQLEFVALWYNEAHGRRPDLPGCMIDGSMVRGEIEPGVTQVNWIWAPRVKNGVILSQPRRRTIKNKNITIATEGPSAPVAASDTKSPEQAQWTRLRKDYNKLMIEVQE